jgi:hypothetical protein
MVKGTTINIVLVRKYISVENVIHQGVALRLWIYMSLNQGLGFGMCVCTHVYAHTQACRHCVTGPSFTLEV